MQRREHAEGLVEHRLYLMNCQIEGEENGGERTLRYLSFLISWEPGVPSGPMYSKTSALALAATSGCCVNI